MEGEETPVDIGDIALNGLERPWELSGPNRFDERGISTRAPSLPSVPDIDKDNFEELEREGHKQMFRLREVYKRSPTLLDGSTGLHYPSRRVRVPGARAVIRENRKLEKSAGHTQQILVQGYR